MTKFFQSIKTLFQEKKWLWGIVIGILVFLILIVAIFLKSKKTPPLSESPSPNTPHPTPNTNPNSIEGVSDSTSQEISQSNLDFVSDVATSNTVAEWSFNEGSGNTVSSSRGSCGVACSGTLVKSKNSRSDWKDYKSSFKGRSSLSFDQDGSFLAINNNNALIFPNKYSLIFWINPDLSAFNHFGGILTWKNDDQSLQVFLSDDGGLVVQIGGIAQKTNPLPTNNPIPWYQIIINKDTNDIISVLINGNKQTLSPISARPIPDRDGIVIGDQYKGSIDDLGIYTTIIEPPHASFLYDQGKTLFLKQQLSKTPPPSTISKQPNTNKTPDNRTEKEITQAVLQEILANPSISPELKVFVEKINKEVQSGERSNPNKEKIIKEIIDFLLSLWKWQWGDPNQNPIIDIFGDIIKNKDGGSIEIGKDISWEELEKIILQEVGKQGNNNGGNGNNPQKDRDYGAVLKAYKDQTGKETIPGGLGLGEDGSGDSIYVWAPSVIRKPQDDENIKKDNSSEPNYVMSYSGNDGLNNRIYQATSDDGSSFNKEDNSIPEDGTVSSGGRVSLRKTDIYTSSPGIFRKHGGSDYTMFYAGNEGEVWEIYRATSNDGKTWTKEGNEPVLKIKDKFIYLSEPTILKERFVNPKGGEESEIDAMPLHMFFAGNDGKNWRIYHAISINGGSSWKESSSPVINLSSNMVYVSSPTVVIDYIKFEYKKICIGIPVFHMFYAGNNGKQWEIYHAITFGSPMAPWIKIPSPVISIGDEGSLDYIYASQPSVTLYNGDEMNCKEGMNNFEMWYAGNDGKNWRILKAESSDFGFFWNKVSNSGYGF